MKKEYKPLNMVMNGRYATLYRKLSDKEQEYTLSRMAELLAEEKDYAEGIKALQTPGHLVAVIVLTAAVAVLGIWPCARTDKKSAKLLS